MIDQPKAIIIAGAIIGAFLFVGMWLFIPTYMALQTEENGVVRMNARNGDVFACKGQTCGIVNLDGETRNMHQLDSN